MTLGEIYKDITTLCNERISESTVLEIEKGCDEEFYLTDEQSFYLISLEHPQSIILGLISFQKHLLQHDEDSLFFIQSKDIIHLVFELILDKNNISVIIESMKLLQYYPFKPGFSLNSDMRFLLVGRLLQLLKQPFESLILAVIDFLIFFANVEKNLVPEIAVTQLYLTCLIIKKEFTILNESEYYKRILSLLDCLFTNQIEFPPDFFHFCLNPFLFEVIESFPQMDYDIKPKMLVFLHKLQSIVEPDNMIPIFPAFLTIFENHEITDIELLLPFLNENSDVGFLLWMNHQSFMSEFILEMLSSDEIDSELSVHLFHYIYIVIKDDPIALFSNAEPYNGFYAFMRQYFVDGSFLCKIELIKLFSHIMNTEIAHNLLNDNFLEDLCDIMSSEHLEVFDEIMQCINKYAHDMVILNEKNATEISEQYQTMFSFIEEIKGNSDFNTKGSSDEESTNSLEKAQAFDEILPDSKNTDIPKNDLEDTVSVISDQDQGHMSVISDQDQEHMSVISDQDQEHMSVISDQDQEHMLSLLSFIEQTISKLEEEFPDCSESLNAICFAQFFSEKVPLINFDDEDAAKFYDHCSELVSQTIKSRPP